jgi:hypothetical protein
VTEAAPPANRTGTSPDGGGRIRVTSAAAPEVTSNPSRFSTPRSAVSRRTGPADSIRQGTDAPSMIVAAAPCLRASLAKATTTVSPRSSTLGGRPSNLAR